MAFNMQKELINRQLELAKEKKFEELEYVTVPVASELSGKSRASIYSQHKSGRLESISVEGQGVWISVPSLREYMKEKGHGKRNVATAFTSEISLEDIEILRKVLLSETGIYPEL